MDDRHVKLAVEMATNMVRAAGLATMKCAVSNWISLKLLMAT